MEKVEYSEEKKGIALTDNMSRGVKLTRCECNS